MPTMPLKRLALMFVLASLAGLSGCTTNSAVFEGRSPEQVWTVMVTVAQSPEYEDWTIMENNVWVDPNYDRVEINRRLKRDYHHPDIEPVRQIETYDMQFILERTDPPIVSATIRNPVIPVKGQEMISHFFDEMRKLLSPIPNQPAIQTSGSPAVEIEEVDLEIEEVDLDQR